MRITANVSDTLGADAKIFAGNENISVSKLITKALESYLAHQKKGKLGEELLSLAGKGHVRPDANRELEMGRLDGRA